MTEHIGDAHGRIALWLDKQSALDLADTFGPSDLAYAEIRAAVERAYPPPEPLDKEKGERLGSPVL